MVSLNHSSHVTSCFRNRGELCFTASLDCALKGLSRESTSSFCRLEIFPPYSFDNSFRFLVPPCPSHFPSLVYPFDFIRTANDSAVSVASSAPRLVYITSESALEMRFTSPYLGNVTGVFANEMQIH